MTTTTAEALQRHDPGGETPQRPPSSPGSSSTATRGGASPSATPPAGTPSRSAARRPSPGTPGRPPGAPPPTRRGRGARRVRLRPRPGRPPHRLHRVGRAAGRGRGGGGPGGRAGRGWTRGCGPCRVRRGQRIGARPGQPAALRAHLHVQGRRPPRPRPAPPAVRKRKQWLLYVDRWLLCLTWQGASAPAYEHWFAMANQSFLTFEIPQALWFFTDRELLATLPGGRDGGAAGPAGPVGTAGKSAPPALSREPARCRRRGGRRGAPGAGGRGAAGGVGLRAALRLLRPRARPLLRQLLDLAQHGRGGGRLRLPEGGRPGRRLPGADPGDRPVRVRPGPRRRAVPAAPPWSTRGGPRCAARTAPCAASRGASSGSPGCWWGPSPSAC